MRIKVKTISRILTVDLDNILSLTVSKHNPKLYSLFLKDNSSPYFLRKSAYTALSNSIWKYKNGSTA